MKEVWTYRRQKEKKRKKAGKCKFLLFFLTKKYPSKNGYFFLKDNCQNSQLGENNAIISLNRFTNRRSFIKSKKLKKMNGEHSRNSEKKQFLWLIGSFKKITYLYNIKTTFEYKKKVIK